MFVQFYLKSRNEIYIYDSVNLIDVCRHKFPSGKDRKCLTFVLDDGKTVNFPFSEVLDLCIENHKDERHPWNDDSKIIFVEDGQAYEKNQK